MYESFLSFARTIPHCRRDFTEWHKGIRRYGFWAVLVSDPGWIELLEAVRAKVRQFLHPGYRRAPHITVAACGLLSEDRFSSRLQRRQAAALAEAELEPFLLEAGGPDSFASAPYLSIEDPSGSLNRIRSILASISEEDNPAGYTPHLTLGLYKEAYETVTVAEQIKEFDFPPIRPLAVRELSFCAYETGDIQGPFVVLERVALKKD